LDRRLDVTQLIAAILLQHQAAGQILGGEAAKFFLAAGF
jgi:hypothetical protein